MQHCSSARLSSSPSAPPYCARRKKREGHVLVSRQTIMLAWPDVHSSVTTNTGDIEGPWEQNTSLFFFENSVACLRLVVLPCLALCILASSWTQCTYLLGMFMYKKICIFSIGRQTRSWVYLLGLTQILIDLWVSSGEFYFGEFKSERVRLRKILVSLSRTKEQDLFL